MMNNLLIICIPFVQITYSWLSACQLIMSKPSRQRATEGHSVELTTAVADGGKQIDFFHSVQSVDQSHSNFKLNLDSKFSLERSQLRSSAGLFSLHIQTGDHWVHTVSEAVAGYYVCYLHSASARCENGNCVD